MSSGPQKSCVPQPFRTSPIAIHEQSWSVPRLRSSRKLWAHSGWAVEWRQMGDWCSACPLQIPLEKKSSEADLIQNNVSNQEAAPASYRDTLEVHSACHTGSSATRDFGALLQHITHFPEKMPALESSWFLRPTPDHILPACCLLHPYSCTDPWEKAC